MDLFCVVVFCDDKRAKAVFYWIKYGISVDMWLAFGIFLHIHLVRQDVIRDYVLTYLFTYLRFKTGLDLHNLLHIIRKRLQRDVVFSFNSFFFNYFCLLKWKKKNSECNLIRIGYAYRSLFERKITLKLIKCPLRIRYESVEKILKKITFIIILNFWIENRKSKALQI